MGGNGILPGHLRAPLQRGRCALDASPVLLSNPDTAAQTKPAIGVRADGSYLVAWTAGGNQDGNGNGVFAVALNPNGSPNGGEFLVNTTTQGNQQDAAAAWQGANAVIAWDGNGAGDSNGVFFQHYVTDYPPTVATPAAATPSPVTGTTAALSVLGADQDGESTLTYTWATTGTTPAPVAFSANGTNAAKDTTATFTQAGTYSFLVTITNSAGLTTTSSVAVQVNQTLTSIVVSPVTAALNENGQRQFTAAAYDQFGNSMASQPSFLWSLVSGTGSVTQAGEYAATGASGSATVRAASGSIAGTASVTVTNAAPAVAAPAAASPNPVTGTTTSLSVLGADDGGESNLTYTWATTGTPPASVSFSVNSTNSADNTTATFTKAGTYNFQVTIADAGGLTATSSISVQVNQVATALVVSPASATVNVNGSEPFSAAVDDQFGSPLAVQPSVIWSLASGSGSVSGAGLYTAPGSATTARVAAAAAGLSGSASVSVVASLQTIVVDTADDVVNGTVTSDSALLASPGADGISLREAILAANNTPATTIIQFNIGGGGQQTISLTSALPTIAEPVIIDGSTQPGFAGAPLIDLNGSVAGATANGLTIAAGNCTVSGLVINGFGGSGIELTTNGNNVVEGNYIGTNASGTSSVPNGAYGIDLASGSADTIGGAAAGAGNVISGNTQGGIRVTGGSYLVSEDNSVVRVDSQTGAVLATYATGLANDSVAVGSDGCFYVPDYYNNDIRRYDAAGNLLATFGAGHLSSPQDLIFGPDGDLYVGNVGGGIQKFTPSGTFISTFVANGIGGLNNVKGMVFGPDGNFYVANLNNSDVLKFNGTTGALIGTFVSSGSGGLSEPEDLTFGPDGNLYITDYATNAVDRYNGITGASLGVFISGIPANPYGLHLMPPEISTSPVVPVARSGPTAARPAPFYIIW